eukprot:366489-Chlamydomonas_euryale.AAC.12
MRSCLARQVWRIWCTRPSQPPPPTPPFARTARGDAWTVGRQGVRLHALADPGAVAGDGLAPRAASAVRPSVEPHLVPRRRRPGPVRRGDVWGVGCGATPFTVTQKTWTGAASDVWCGRVGCGV